MEQKNDKKVIQSWAFFDWANSSYNLVITSTIFPAYYTIITTTAAHGDQVTFFGLKFTNTALSNYALSLAYLMMVILLPILSATADYRGNKKIFMKIFTYIGGIACMGLFFFKLDTLELGIICFIIAAMGYIGGVLFNNSYLPEIATKDQQDRVSAQGYAYGYIGSVLLQLICFIFVLKPELFGITDGSLPARMSFLLVGIWWIGFAQISFNRLPAGSPNYTAINKNVVHSGFGELAKVWRQLKSMKVMKRFLIAFFFYSMGVQTVMLAAAGFGEKTLHLGTSKLIAVILIIQLVAILGAIWMSKLAKKIGNVSVLILVVGIWVMTCIAAYFITNEYEFYGLAAVVGLIMGGIQSLSRSTYSKFIPEHTPDTASFFSFYDVTEKLAVVIGLFSFAYIEEQTGNMRNSVLALASFFVLGLIFLLLLRKVAPKMVKG
ncbi:MFS transporter, UMF1 family [Pedobacter steynii]|uniref:MFS transporter, UMF1 family n=1 Tax=Pedobacter steynii TaxID=430522 RepID=A0A1G9JZ50_9SPHI|nr:MFS transporter [Pedobacter steynii]NQX38399.1 MFS transporter [Pedobacter steynii]SDL42788.1 MFS transporter, UMF1 family [Pedobacter steynii]